MASSAQAQSGSDPLANLHFLVGTWSCTADMAAGPAGPARTMKGTLTFSSGPDSNSLLAVFAAPHYESHEFMGYNPVTKAWFSAYADNYGGFGSQTGHNASANGIMFSGSMTEMGRTMQVRDTRTKISDTKIRHVGEELDGGVWKQTQQADCTKM